MKTVGLITEYNPFHNGHLYHIEKAKELTGADRVVVIMSGDYVQRGAPALLPKHLRTQMALLNGASVVLELPVCYSTGSAEFFAEGSVSILNGLGCIDALCFGSECGDLNLLKQIAHLLVSESDTYRYYLQEALKSGVSFPAARCQALEKLTGNFFISQILSDPNNILGIEYLKALEKTNSLITPFTIKRESSGYHDTELNSHSSSATAIRNSLKQIKDTHCIEMPTSTTGINLSNLLYGQLPDNSLDILQNAWERSCPVEVNDFSLLLKYKLLLETKESLCRYQDVSAELANRITRNLNQFRSFDQFCELLKTKELTYSRISRSLLHILLSITKDDMCQDASDFYARILGFRKDQSDILRAMKGHASIPVITKLGQNGSLSANAINMMNRTIFASDLYESVISNKFGTPFINEYQKQIVRI